MEQLVTNQPMAETMQIQQIQVTDIVSMTKDLFVSMLEMPLSTIGCAEWDPAFKGLQATVRINGDWNAELRVIASDKLAQVIACAMFDMCEPDLSTSEKLDALGEVANVIGGNIKGNVGVESDLSLPCVGDTYTEIPSDALLQSFRCANETLHVVLIQE